MKQGEVWLVNLDPTVRSVSQERLSKKIGGLDLETMSKIRRALALVFTID